MVAGALVAHGSIRQDDCAVGDVPVQHAAGAKEHQALRPQGVDLLLLAHAVRRADAGEVQGQLHIMVANLVHREALAGAFQFSDDFRIGEQRPHPVKGDEGEAADRHLRHARQGLNHHLRGEDRRFAGIELVQQHGNDPPITACSIIAYPDRKCNREKHFPATIEN